MQGSVSKGTVEHSKLQADGSRSGLPGPCVQGQLVVMQDMECRWGFAPFCWSSILLQPDPTVQPPAHHIFGNKLGCETEAVTMCVTGRGHCMR